MVLCLEPWGTMIKRNFKKMFPSLPEIGIFTRIVISVSAFGFGRNRNFFSVSVSVSAEKKNGCFG